MAARWIRNDPPPFGSFSKNHPNLTIRSSLISLRDNISANVNEELFKTFTSFSLLPHLIFSSRLLTSCEKGWYQERKLQRGELHPMGSVLLVASSNHVDLTVQVADALQSHVETSSQGEFLKLIESFEIIEPICYQKD